MGWVEGWGATACQTRGCTLELCFCFGRNFPERHEESEKIGEESAKEAGGSAQNEGRRGRQVV